MWEVASGYCVRTFTGHTDWVRCLAVNAEGSLLASSGNDQAIILWNVSTGAPALTLKEHTHVVESLAFPPAGTEVKLLADAGSSSGGGPDGAAEDKENEGNAAREAVVAGERQQHHQRHYLVSGGRDKTVRLWDTSTGLCLMTFADHDNWVRAVCFHPSGQYVLSCSDDRSIRVFDLAKGRCIRTLAEAHAQFVTALAQHPSLPYVASGSVDREIRVWECK